MHSNISLYLFRKKQKCRVFRTEKIRNLWILIICKYFFIKKRSKEKKKKEMLQKKKQNVKIITFREKTKNNPIVLIVGTASLHTILSIHTTYHTFHV